MHWKLRIKPSFHPNFRSSRQSTELSAETCNCLQNRLRIGFLIPCIRLKPCLCNCISPANPMDAPPLRASYPGRFRERGLARRGSAVLTRQSFNFAQNEVSHPLILAGSALSASRRAQPRCAQGPPYPGQQQSPASAAAFGGRSARHARNGSATTFPPAAISACCSI